MLNAITLSGVFTAMQGHVVCTRDWNSALNGHATPVMQHCTVLNTIITPFMTITFREIMEFALYFFNARKAVEGCQARHAKRVYDFPK